MNFIYIITLLLFVQCSHQKILKREYKKKKNEQKAPYEVGLRIKWGDNSTMLCGGSLIKPSFVLTAASCFPEDRGEIKLLRIYIGTKSLLHKDTGVECGKAKKIIKYNEFDSNLKYKDIAVIELRKPVTLSDKIALVQLSNISDVNLLVGKMGLLSGSEASDETNKADKNYTKIKVRIGSLYRTKNKKVTDPTRILGVSPVKFGKRCYCGLLGSPLMLGNTNTQIGISAVQGQQIYYGNTGNIYTNFGPYPNTQIGLQGSQIYYGNPGIVNTNYGPYPNTQIGIQGPIIHNGYYPNNIYTNVGPYPNTQIGIQGPIIHNGNYPNNIYTNVGPYPNTQIGIQGPAIHNGNSGIINTNFGPYPNTQIGIQGPIIHNGNYPNNVGPYPNTQIGIQSPAIHNGNSGIINTNFGSYPNTQIGAQGSTIYPGNPNTIANAEPSGTAQINGSSVPGPQNTQGSNGFIFTNVGPYADWLNNVSAGRVGETNNSDKLYSNIRLRINSL